MKGIGRTLVALVGAAAIAVAVSACGSSDSGGDTVSLRLGYVTTPAHPYGITVDAFAAEVAEASGGTIEITTVPTYAGGDDAALLDDVSKNVVEMAAVSTAVWDSKGVDVFQPLQAPFVITNYGLAQAVEGGDIGYDMLDHPNGPAKLNLHGLGILEGGLRKPLGAKKALTSVAAFKGQKIRAPASKVMTNGLKALGAEPVGMPLPDVYGALQTGAVNGMEANYGLIFTQKYFEVAKYITVDVTIWPFPAAVVINQDQWDSLTAEQQQILTDAGKNIAKNSANIFLNPAPDATNFVVELCNAGMVFASAGDENRAALAAKAQPALDALLANADTKDFLTRIQQLKEDLGPPPAPPALPAGCKTS